MRYIFVIISILTVCIGYSQYTTDQLFDEKFFYDQEDSIYHGTHLSFITRHDSLRNETHYLQFFNDGTIEIGFEKDGTPYGQWMKVNQRYRAISSLNFDTLTFQKEEIAGALEKAGLSLDTLKIHFSYDRDPYGMDYHWIVSKERQTKDGFIVQSGVAINAHNGKLSPYEHKVFTNSNMLLEHLPCPKFVGGMAEMTGFFHKNIKYPEEDIDEHIEGVVLVEFHIDAHGNTSHYRVKRGLSDAINAEAIRVVKMVPGWFPGKVDNQVIGCKFTIPVLFEIP